MSRIAELGTDYKNLPAVLASYDEDLEQIRKIMPLNGKTLEQAFKEQCAWPYIYGIKKAELKTLLNYMEQRVAAVHGELHRRFNENHSRELGERTINQYIKNEKAWLSVDGLRLEVQELYEQFCEIMNAFDKRGFALRDMTAARVAEFHREQLE